MADHLLLVGMMGAGKTTVARLVAARTGRALVDTDAEVERALGATVADVFARRGEATFRRAESEALRRAVAGDRPAVVSVGGGMVLDPVNRQTLTRAGTVVWLRASPATLADRVGALADRPLLRSRGEDRAAVLTRLAAQRQGLYAEVADAVVDVDDLDADAVADKVLACVSTAPGGPPGDRS